MINKIREIPVVNNLGNHKDIRALYEKAFPESEKFPYPLIFLMSFRKGFEYSAYYDGDVFCGLSYIINNDTDTFILYLAVNDKIRSKGYGTTILKKIKHKHSGKQIFLNIELLDVQADNLTQRKKRIQFYEKNVFL